jgi:hypothetical protein
MSEAIHIECTYSGKSAEYLGATFTPDHLRKWLRPLLIRAGIASGEFLFIVYGTYSRMRNNKTFVVDGTTRYQVSIRARIVGTDGKELCLYTSLDSKDKLQGFKHMMLGLAETLNWEYQTDSGVITKRASNESRDELKETRRRLESRKSQLKGAHSRLKKAVADARRIRNIIAALEKEERELMNKSGEA